MGLSLPWVCTLVQQHLQLRSDILRGVHEESRVPRVTLLENTQTESLQPCKGKYNNNLKVIIIPTTPLQSSWKKKSLSYQFDVKQIR